MIKASSKPLSRGGVRPVAPSPPEMKIPGLHFVDPVNLRLDFLGGHPRIGLFPGHGRSPGRGGQQHRGKRSVPGPAHSIASSAQPGKQQIGKPGIVPIGGQSAGANNHHVGAGNDIDALAAEAVEVGHVAGGERFRVIGPQ